MPEIAQKGHSGIFGNLIGLKRPVSREEFFTEQELKLGAEKFRALLPDSPEMFMNAVGRRDFLTRFQEAIDFVAGLGQMRTLHVRPAPFSKVISVPELVRNQLRAIDDHFSELFDAAPDPEDREGLRRQIWGIASRIPSFNMEIRGPGQIFGLMLCQYLFVRAELDSFRLNQNEDTFKIILGRIGTIKGWFQKSPFADITYGSAFRHLPS